MGRSGLNAVWGGRCAWEVRVKRCRFALRRERLCATVPPRVVGGAQRSLHPRRLHPAEPLARAARLARARASQRVDLLLDHLEPSHLYTEGEEAALRFDPSHCMEAEGCVLGAGFISGRVTLSFSCASPTTDSSFAPSFGRRPCPSDIVSALASNAA